jgi:DNA-binding NarL/FixJ family response regulator
MLSHVGVKSERARLLVVDDEPVVCRSLRRLAARYADVVEAHSVDEACASLVDGTCWTAVIIDWRLDSRLGDEVLELARARDPLLACMLLTGDPDDRASLAAWEHGVPLFIKPLRSPGLRAFVTYAVAAATEFGRAVGEGVQRWRLLYRFPAASAEVLHRRAIGESPAAVADGMGISENTYKKHVHNLLERTGGDSIEAEIARLLREVFIARGATVKPTP